MPYEPMETLIENTTMQKFINSLGNHTMYRVEPNEGYVLHDKRLDIHEEYDEETGLGIGEPITVRYYAGSRNLPASYDFAANPWEFYAVLRSSVPEDNICDLTNPPEIMSEEPEPERE